MIKDAIFYIKYYADKHQAVKSRDKQVKSRQSEQVISHSRGSEQNYSKPISKPKATYQPRHSSKSEKTISKRSFENRQKSRNNSSNKNQNKREN